MRLDIRSAGTILLALTLGAAIAAANDGDPPTAHTGAPAVASVQAERLCSRCHSGNALNTQGSVAILDAPASYTAGAVYTLRVRVTSTATAASVNRVWGFQLTAVRDADGGPAGTLANVAGQGTVVATGSSSYGTRQYAAVGTNNHAGAASPVEWQVRWTAPAPPVGAVTFHAAGIAANGSGTSNDWIYTTSLASADATTPTKPVTWGNLKKRYR